MKPKKIKKYYISILLETLSEAEYKEEVIRLKYILGAHPKPQRSKQMQEFCDFIQDKIYKGNTAFEILKKKFNFETDSADFKLWMKKTKLSEQDLKEEVERAQTIARKRIAKEFRKYKDQLNKFLK